MSIEAPDTATPTKLPVQKDASEITDFAFGFVGKYLTTSVTLLSGSTFVLSLAYQSGYFAYYDINLLTFLSIQDFISLALSWVPSVFIFFAILYFRNRIQWNRVQLAGLFNFTFGLEEIANILYSILMILIVLLLSPLYVYPYLIITGLVGILTLLTLLFPSRNRTIDVRSIKVTRALVSLLPLLVLFLGAYGYISGYISAGQTEVQSTL